MGCIGSKPASPSEQNEMCKEACKSVMTTIVPQALASGSQVTITAPEKELASIRKMATDLRAAATEAKTKMAEAGHTATGKVGSIAASTGGAVGSLLTKAVNAVDSVVDKTAAIAGGGLEHALTALADGLDNQLKSLDDKFATIGKEILENKKENITAVYSEQITACSFDQAPSLCQGQGSDAITAAFHVQMRQALAEKMSPIVKEAAASGLAAAWNSAVDKVNSANEKLGSTEWGAKYKQAPITLDFNKFVADQMVTKLETVLSQKERDLRSSPPDNKLLSVCLAKKEITKTAYDTWKKGSV